MSNPTRLMYRNTARATGIAASTSAAGYPASALLKADKDSSWRAGGVTATLSGSSATMQSAAGLILARCNLSQTSTMRLQLWRDEARTDQTLDTGFKLARPAPDVEMDGWTPAQAASAYAYGGGADAALWFNSAPFRAWTLTINDASNLQGYIEACYLMLGPTWSPTYDLEEGASFTPRTTDTQFRTAAGSLKGRRGIRFREIPLDLSLMNAADRAEALRLLRYVGRTGPVGVALYPDDEDVELARDTIMIGLITDDAEMVLNGPDLFATKINLSEI